MLDYPQSSWHSHPTRGVKYRLSAANSTPGATLLANFKGHIRVTGTAQDTELTRFLNVAAAKFEDETDRRLINTSTVEYMDLWPWDYGNVWQLHLAPVSAVTSIKYYDPDGVQQTYSSSYYQTDLVNEPVRIVLDPDATATSPNLDERPNAVEVAYTAGYGAAATNIPDGIINALFVYAAWLHTQGRELTPGQVAPEAIERCWQAAVRNWAWRAC